MFLNIRQLLILAIFASLGAGWGRDVRGDDDDAPQLPAASEDPPEQPPEQKPVRRKKTVRRRAEGRFTTAYDEVQSPPLPTETEEAESPSNPPKSVESLLPDPEKLIPQFEPEAGQDGGPDTGLTPVRWLNQNDQFLNEGDPYPPGQDPFRERPGLPVGWFSEVDLFVVHPEIDSQVNNSHLAPGDPFHGTFTNSKQLPVGDMNWTVSPKIQVGYRRENGEGEYIASYRYIESNVSGTLANFDAAGAGQLHTRSQAQALDLVYAFSDRTEGLHWILPTVRRYSLGLRVASWIYDTTANGQQVLEERAGNVFIGGGPVLLYDWTWLTNVPAVTFNGGFDAAGVGGFNYQRFAETAVVSGSVQTARGRTDGTGTATPILGVWGGLSWAPDWRNQTFKLSAGYRWEKWWNLPDAGGQNDLTLQGPFVRGEFRW